MKDYPQKEGKYGPIYLVARGVTVSMSRKKTWELSISHGGERDRRRFGKDLEKAIKYAEFAAAKLGVGEAKEPKFYTVNLAIEAWQKTNKGKWSESTRERYEQIVRDYILPSFDGRELAKINKPQLKECFADLLEIKSPKTVELIIAVWSGIFKEAIENGRTAENPIYGIAGRVLPPKRKRNIRKPDPISREEIHVVLDASRRHLPGHLHLVLETMAKTGMRLGECLAVHADRLDARNCQYLVGESIRRERVGTTKTGEDRLIDLPSDLVVKLEARILELKKNALRTGEDVGYLFPGITQRMVQGALKRACRFAKVRVRTPHALRHTYATILLMEHYSPVYVQKQLGHASITMTVDTYGHWLPGEGRKDLEGVLSG